MVLVFRVIPYYRITRYFPMLVFRVIPYYRIIRYFPITVLISRAGSELFGGWGGCGSGCDDSMEESAIAIPDCIPALDSRDSTARIVRIAYPRLLYPVSFVSQSRHKRCKPQVDTILSKQVLGWSDSCCTNGHRHFSKDL